MKCMKWEGHCIECDPVNNPAIGLIKVGTNDKKEVTLLNRALYLKAKDITMDYENQGCSHIGLIGIGLFIDWLEENYGLVKKEK